MKKILTVSLFAMMAVSAANADIASTDYVGKQITATAGTLTSLKTTAKGNLVAAINEVDDNIGTVSFTAEGSTQGKTNLTEAIAAVDAFVQGMGNVQADITTSINELDGAIETLNGDAQTAGSVLKSINDHAVNSVTSGTTNGTIKVDGAEVAVKGLGSAAYTESSAYATAAQGTKADTAVQTVATGTNNGTIKVDGTDVAVKGLGTAAYTASSAYATAAQGTKADSAVQTVTQGTTNGTIKVDGTEVAVKGLGSAAYTASSAYATSAQGTKADNALARTQIGAAANFTIPDECKAENAVCSLVVRKGVAGWEKVTY